MKSSIFLLMFLIYASYEVELKVFEVIYLKTLKLNEKEAAICLNVEKFDTNKKLYLLMTSNKGSISNAKYEFINTSCPETYKYNPQDNKLKEAKKSSSSSNNGKFSYEYEFQKEENSKNIIVVYTEFTGEELSLTYSNVKAKDAIIFILLILAGLIVFIIVLCCCCYCCCKSRQKNIISNDYYKTSFASPILA